MTEEQVNSWGYIYIHRWMPSSLEVILTKKYYNTALCKDALIKSPRNNYYVTVNKKYLKCEKHVL
jgi:hypothetical protein